MDKFDKLLLAAYDLLSSRYNDGEVDAVALSSFAAVVEEVDPNRTYHTFHAGHRMIIEDEPPFKPRRGCLDCNVWLDPVEVIK